MGIAEAEVSARMDEAWNARVGNVVVGLHLSCRL